MLLIYLFILIGLSFAFVVFFGAPYLPTFNKQVEIALDLADLQSGETLLELGCGDGRVLIAAAKRGVNVVGYELNPLLVLFCWVRTRKYRKHVRVVWGNFWTKKWPHADTVFVFLLDKYMKKLDKKIIQTYPGKNVKLVSFAFEIPAKNILKERQGIKLYTYK